MKTGLKDLKGNDINIGDKFRFIYKDPMGRLNPSTLDDGLYEIAYEHGAVVAKYIEGHGVEAENPRLLRNWIETEEGRYISNYGYLTVYKNNVVLGEVVEQGLGEQKDSGELDVKKLLMTLIDNIEYVYAKTDGTYGNLHPNIAGNIQYIRDQIRKHNKD